MDIYEIMEGLVYIDETLDMLDQAYIEDSKKSSHCAPALIYKINFQMARNVLKNILLEKDKIQN